MGWAELPRMGWRPALACFDTERSVGFRSTRNIHCTGRMDRALERGAWNRPEKLTEQIDAPYHRDTLLSPATDTVEIISAVRMALLTRSRIYVGQE